MPIRTKHASENDDADLFSTAESSQNDAADDGDIVEMTETRVEVIDEEMKEVMEKLDQDLHKIVQMSDEIERAMAVNELSMQQDEPVNEEIPMEREELAEESKELYVTDEIEDIEELIKEPEVNDEEVILEDFAVETFDEEEYSMQEPDDTDETENVSNLTQEDQSDQSEITTIVEFDSTSVQMDEISSSVPMAVEEDDEDYNDIDYIDEEEGEEEDDIAGALSDDPSEGSAEDIDRPFSADIFERHVQQVIAEDFPDDKNAKAPAVQIISSKLNEIMSREAVATKPTEVVLAPYEVISIIGIGFNLSSLQFFLQRKVRQLLAEGRATSYEKAELAARLMDLKFDEDEAIYAANECGSLYMAISYLQQDCELCASKYGVKEVHNNKIMDAEDADWNIFHLDGLYASLHTSMLSRMCRDLLCYSNSWPIDHGCRLSVLFRAGQFSVGRGSGFGLFHAFGHFAQGDRTARHSRALPA